MKKLLALCVLVVLLASLGYSQTGVRTEAASNKFYHKQAVVTLDTIASRSSTTGSTGYLVGIVWNAPVASDSVILRTGIDTIGVYVTGSTAPTAPFFVPIGCMLDSLFRFEKRKNSDVTIIYRTNY